MSYSNTVISNGSKFPSDASRSPEYGVAGQRFLTAIIGKWREGGNFHVTRTHRTETVGNLSILNTIPA